MYEAKSVHGSKIGPDREIRLGYWVEIQVSGLESIACSSYLEAAEIE
jgi:hypothetical protein